MPEAGKKPAQTLATQSFEGDYRPSSEALPLPGSIKVDPLQTEFLMRLANALNTTLDLQTLLHRTADLVRAVIDYKIFAILLLNERTNDLRMRFQIGHTPEVERLRIRVGKGVVGRAAEHRESVLLQDVTQDDNYISANPDVRSELAVPLIVKNRVIGVIDLQSEQVGYFQPEHRRLLELTASRVAQAIENARLYTRVARQAQTLAVLNEISREVTSILDLDPLLERIGELLRRIIDYQMFSILLVNEREQVLEIQYAVRFGHLVAPSETVPLDRGLVGTAVRERRLIYSGDVRKDARYYMVNPETRSEMAVPLLYKGKVIGVLDLEHVRGQLLQRRSPAHPGNPCLADCRGYRKRAAVSAGWRNRNSVWSTISTWRAMYSCGSCRPRRRASRMPSSPPGFCPPGPSAETSTTSCPTTTNASASPWEMSAARQLLLRSMRR